jgi:PPK2 family polyphosphate:nucleotide phosphotransferase
MDLHRIAPGSRVDLGAIDTRDVSAAPGDKEATRAVTAELAHRLEELQHLLWAESRNRVLVVLQGIDTAGKGGTIRRVFQSVNPAGVRVAAFKAPDDVERARDPLWRIHREVPADGELVIFDRSHYEDVLVVRVKDLAPEERWRPRFDHINAFEEMLVHEGTTICKVFLHISRAEQQERLQARLDDPRKHWKFDAGDLEERGRWDDYQAAFTEAIERTSTPHAPWHVVPADRKWYRDWAVSTILVDMLEALDMRYPAPSVDVSAITID